MKLYGLLILAKNTKKYKNNIKAPKNTKLVLFPSGILPCKQKQSAVYTLYHKFPRLRR